MSFLQEAKSLSGNKNVGFNSKRSGFEKRKARAGWMFISPWIIGFLAFYLIPILASLYLSFTDFDPRQAEDMKWIGLENWVNLFSDARLGDSLKTTLTFMLVALPISIVFPILIAALLNMKQLMFKRFFTTLFYIPFMVPLVAAIVIWRGFLNKETGWLNRMLGTIGLPEPDWMNDPNVVIWALIIISLWGVGNAMLITLVSMQGVPTDLYEAGRIDGAGPLRLFWNITIPLITPVIFYNVILAVVGLFRYFEVPYILSRGSGQPGNSMWFFNLHFYRQAFTEFNFGYACALGWLLFIIAMSITLVIFATSRFWVYSPGGD